MRRDPDHPADPTTDRSRRSGPGLSPLKKLAFAAIVTVLFFGLVEVALALLGISPKSYEDDPYVGFSGRSPLFVEVRQGDGSVVMERSPAKAALFNPQQFPRQKPPGAVRIFCVGGSTTYGRPYDDSTSFCGWLRELLASAAPGRRFEVINAGGISYASYRVALLMEELIRYEPDLFIVYSGHNEFLERRTYPQIISTPRTVRGLGAVASRTRIWTALESVLADRRPDPESPAAGDADVLGAEVVTLLDEAVGPDAYSRDDRLREQVLRHYRFNLARMVDIAGSADAGVVLVTPASNLRHTTPFKSEHGPTFAPDKQARWEELLGQGIALYRQGDPVTAAARFGGAVELDPRHAAAQYLLGQALYVVGRFDESRSALERARDEDICPLRALGPMAGIVREVAQERDAALVDFEQLVESRSEHGIPGNTHFLDHVHPTIETNRMLALAILDRLTNLRVVEPAAGWGGDAVAEVVARVEGKLDPLDHAIALTNLAKVLGWAGKQQESYQLTRRAVELGPEDVQVQYHDGLAADLLGRHDEAMVHYRKAIEILPTADLPHGNLGVGLEREGRLDEAVEHYRLAFRYASPEMLEHHRENLANALLKRGYAVYGERRFDEAVSLLTEADQVRPEDPEILVRLGVALVGAGRPDEAAARFEAAAELRPGDAGIRSRQALALAIAGRLDEAAEAYALALEIAPEIAEAPSNPMVVLERMGRAELAEELRSKVAGG
jgi:tetratricopeptide (TPR) repeat protein